MFPGTSAPRINKTPVCRDAGSPRTLNLCPGFGRKCTADGPKTGPKPYFVT